MRDFIARLEPAGDDADAHGAIHLQPPGPARGSRPGFDDKAKPAEHW
ncbi:MAG: hypothetical protein U0793_15825 [Gemmataceae bacterium]